MTRLNANLANVPALYAWACDGDEALRLEVESLLAQHAPADSFLDRPAVAAAQHC